ncbi:MAG: sigma-54-dependent Fis family transcriptional regulator [Myxococcales bacterium]|nr:sigma-54-dependent Fis family transcriptional regulator [Myxococcales bacterium]
MSGRVLVVDDEPRMAEVVRMVLRRAGLTVDVALGGEDALSALRAAPPDLLLTDLRMPGMDGLALMEQARALDAELPIILMTAHATLQNAIDALRLGAHDYVQKPFENAELVARVSRGLALRALTRENRYLRGALLREQGPAQVIAESEPMRAVLELVSRVAPSDATVMIEGESGVGKEVVARALHLGSPRAGGPFVAVNVSALAESVLESELFGHERGAFTGAHARKAGLFERASGGTLFLDEIGEVGPEFQAKLLRVLQEREVTRVGGQAPVRVDVRVLTATHRDLPRAVAAGQFREDLFFRLAVIPMRVPPLRERRADIAPLALHFLTRHGDETRRPLRFSDAAMEALEAHAFPGNVRELENAVLRAVVLARGSEVQVEDLMLGGSAVGAAGLEPPRRSASGEGFATLAAHLDAATREHIAAALQRAAGVKHEAATLLGVERTTLYRLLKKGEGG